MTSSPSRRLSKQAAPPARKPRALLEATITARAQTLKNEADKDVTVARENGGEQLNKTLFDQIVKNNEAAIAALTKIQI